MRKLQQITDAVRQNEEATDEELRLAVTAYDVLLSKLELEKDPKQLVKLSEAVETPPRDYIGKDNDPYNEEAAAWHRAFVNVGLY